MEGRTDGWTDEGTNGMSKNYIPLQHTSYAGGIIIKLSQTVWELWPAQDLNFWRDDYITKKVRVVSFMRHAYWSSSSFRRRDKQHICIFYVSVKSRYSIVSRIKHIGWAECFSDMQTPSICLHFSPHPRLSSVFSLNRGEIRAFHYHKWTANQSRFF